MSNRSKNHHYVPQFLQRRFVDKNSGKIWYSKRGPDGIFSIPKFRDTKKIFMERNRNTIIEDDKPTDVVEINHYGPIDSDLAKILSKIQKTLDMERLPYLTKTELKKLKKIIWEIFKRTPDLMKSYSDYETGHRLFKEMVEEAIARGATREALKYQVTLKDSEYLKEYGRNIRVQSTVDAEFGKNKKIAQAMNELHLRYAEINSDSSFILSSKMVHIAGNDGPNGLINPKAEIWLPISPKITLVLLRDPTNKIPSKVIATQDLIDEFNQYATSESKEIASHSKELIESLIKEDTSQSRFSSTKK